MKYQSVVRNVLGISSAPLLVATTGLTLSAVRSVREVEALRWAARS